MTCMPLVLCCSVHPGELTPMQWAPGVLPTGSLRCRRLHTGQDGAHALPRRQHSQGPCRGPGKWTTPSPPVEGGCDISTLNTCVTCAAWRLLPWPMRRCCRESWSLRSGPAPRRSRWHQLVVKELRMMGASQHQRAHSAPSRNVQANETSKRECDRPRECPRR